VVQVPVGTIVYLPEEEEDVDPYKLPFWVTNPGEPWVGARDYRSDGEDSSEEDPGDGVSSDAELKRRLGREVADLKWRGQRFVLAVGGEGGRGNASFPSKTSK
jgi:GTPase involved in cell partitioning and DNA repair